MSDLASDLRAALVANGTIKVCEACDVLESVDTELRAPLASAMEGTIGAKKLSAILERHGHSVSVRTLQRHRKEGHTL